MSLREIADEALTESADGRGVNGGQSKSTNTRRSVRLSVRVLSADNAHVLQ